MSQDGLEDHYARIIGIEEPWAVKSVELNLKGNKVEIEVEYEGDGKVPCPECDSECSKKDLAERRTWRHLDTMQLQTLIHARIPRANCKEHGVKNIKTSWSAPSSRFTLLFTRFAVDVIKACGNVTNAAALLNMSWDEVHLIQKKAVERGLERREAAPIKYLGIDEKSFKKGRNFITVLNDLEHQRVIDVQPTKTKEATLKLLNSLDAITKKSVEAVAMDMAAVYRECVKEVLPDADIVCDKFHISKYLNDAVTSIWKSENRVLRKNNANDLSGTKFIWLKNPQNFSKDQKKTFQQLRTNLYKVGRGWQIKEAFRKFWEYIYKGNAHNFFKKWYFWATHSRLKPIIRVAKMLKRHLDYLLTYFNHRITNAGSEGINSKIQAVKARARGFRNFENYRTAILFFCGGLELHP